MLNKNELRRVVALSVEGPAGAILAAEQVVSLSAIGDAAGGAVIIQLFAHAVGHHAQKHHLNRRAAVIEIA